MKTVKSYRGLIGFVERRGIVPAIIKWFGGTVYSHMTLGYNDVFILDATTPRVKLRRVKKAHSNKEIVKVKWFEANLSKAKISKAVENSLNKYYDTNYSVLQLIGYVWVAIVKFFTGKYVKNPAEDGAKNIVCAELLLYYMRDELDLKELEVIDVNRYDMIKDSFNLVSNSKNFEEVTVLIKEK